MDDIICNYHIYPKISYIDDMAVEVEALPQEPIIFYPCYREQLSGSLRKYLKR